MGLKKIAQAVLVCKAADKVLAKNQSGLRAIMFKGQALFIETPDHFASQKLELEKEKVIAQINEVLGQELVKTLRYRNVRKKR